MAATTDHPVFIQPSNQESRIWRYMDFTKFVSLLETSSLHFARADTLGDPFEGTFSRGNVQLRPVVYSGLENYSDLQKQHSRFQFWLREWTFVNCWHANSFESAAMWKLYGSSGNAVAIETSYANLKECLPEDVYLGFVKYIDYSKDWIPENNSFYPFVHKRISFIHEQEVRGVIQKMVVEDGKIPTGKVNSEMGIKVPVDLAKLIRNIYVSPESPTWFKELTEAIIRKYEFDWPVIRSDLDSEPIY